MHTPLKHVRPLLFGILLVLLAQPAAHARTAVASKPQKKLDFNNALIEDMNQRPLDSLSALSEADKNRRKVHLYKKRANFNPESAETLRQVRYN